MTQNFNWAIIKPDNRIEIYDERPSYRPAFDTLVKDVELITASDGAIWIKGEEIIDHLVTESKPVKDLDWTPIEQDTRVIKEGFFHKTLVTYVKEGWVTDKKTKKYDAKFLGYVIRFFTSGGVQV